MTWHFDQYDVFIRHRHYLLTCLIFLGQFVKVIQVRAQQTLSTQPLLVTSVCPGSQLDVTGFRSFGSIDFTVELSSDGISYWEIPSSFLATSGRYEVTYRATIPATTPPAPNYHIRVVSKNPAVVGTPSSTALTILSFATASLAGNQQINEGYTANFSVTFTGDGPWVFAYRDSSATGMGTILTINAKVNPYVFGLNPRKTSAYILTSVSNGCGNGSLGNRKVIVDVNPLLGIDDPSLLDAVDMYPVPVTTSLTIHVRALEARQVAQLEVTDLTGRTIRKQEVHKGISVLPLDQYTTGIYLLHIYLDDRKITKRIVKL